MRRIGMVLGVALAVGVFAGGTAAQEKSTLMVDPRIGLGFGAGDVGEVVDPGVAFGGRVAYRFHHHMAAWGDVDYQLLENARDEFGTSLAPELDALHFTGGIEAVFEKDPYAAPPFTFRFYVGGGGVNLSGEDATTTFDETYPVFVAGGAIGYRLSRLVEPFVDGRGYFVFMDGNDTRVFSDRSPSVEPFDRGWTTPLTAGVRLHFQL